MSSVTAVQHNETGSITLGVFFGLVLLGVVVTLTWSQMQVAERALRRLISTDRAYDRALVSLTERLNTAAVTSASTSARSALYGAGTFGEITIGATASVITNSARPSLGTAVIDGSQPLSISFPFIDLDHLLPPPTTCPESRGARSADLSPGDLSPWAHSPPPIHADRHHVNSQPGEPFTEISFSRLVRALSQLPRMG